MSRSLVVSAVAVLLLVVAASLSFAQDVKPQEQRLKGPALLDGGTTLVPLRELGEWTGAVVKFAPPHITLSKGIVRVELTLGSSSAALTDGQSSRQLTLARPPRVINDMTYVPLRFVAEAFGVTVDYREADGVVALRMGDRTASLPVRPAGSPNITPPAAPPVASKAVVPFVPPASSGKADEFLAALRAAADEYKTYELDNTHSQIAERELCVTVVNDLHKFSVTRYASPGTVPVMSDVGDATRAQITATILRSTKGYLATRYRVADGARMRIMVMISGNGATDMGDTALTNTTSYDLDIGATPVGGMMSVRLLLIDTQERRLIWFTDKAWGLGKDEDQAAEFASGSIIGRLKELFGVQ